MADYNLVRYVLWEFEKFIVGERFLKKSFIYHIYERNWNGEKHFYDYDTVVKQVEWLMSLCYFKVVLGMS